jgi:hypothetical protein
MHPEKMSNKTDGEQVEDMSVHLFPAIGNDIASEIEVI